MTFIKITIWL